MPKSTHCLLVMDHLAEGLPPVGHVITQHGTTRHGEGFWWRVEQTPELEPHEGRQRARQPFPRLTLGRNLIYVQCHFLFRERERDLWFMLIDASGRPDAKTMQGNVHTTTRAQQRNKGCGFECSTLKPSIVASVKGNNTEIAVSQRMISFL